MQAHLPSVISAAVLILPARDVSLEASYANMHLSRGERQRQPPTSGFVRTTPSFTHIAAVIVTRTVSLRARTPLAVPPPRILASLPSTKNKTSFYRIHCSIPRARIRKALPLGTGRQKARIRTPHKP